MRVLWVEDFGGDSDAGSFLDEVFSELVSSQRLEALVETQGRGKEKGPSSFRVEIDSQNS